MNRIDRKILKEAVRKHGDGFWSGDNVILIDDIIEAADKGGYKLTLSSKRKQT